ncbi:hypothetical protein EJ06DRAFT_527629 [Trichodelitschia bisporula]|uniref:Uncharacterized protein n=1 Tax=Trichodelitschia bisporula TaxID=703511 RepID=A0A6G1I7P4_9PEZI|nr:hypothetical protein EJ06DRAFT_527629 [Trichodelitschia bisporula]
MTSECQGVQLHMLVEALGSWTRFCWARALARLRRTPFGCRITGQTFAAPVSKL